MSYFVLLWKVLWKQRKPSGGGRRGKTRMETIPEGYITVVGSHVENSVENVENSVKSLGKPLNTDKRGFLRMILPQERISEWN